MTTPDDDVTTPEGQTPDVARGRTIQVVVLHQDVGRAHVETSSGRRWIDLGGDAVPPDLVPDLLEQTVTLTAPTGVLPEVVDAVAGQPVPRAFRNNPWLRSHRALLFAGGRCAVGALDLRYQTELGVYPA